MTYNVFGGTLSLTQSINQSCGVCCALYRSGSALSQLYGTEATLEHHHFNHAVMILNSDVCIRFEMVF